ncbi:DUF5714 domain-containing protein [Ruminococcaceae bacterium OttesenSCG-928-I18]|nr:DUF5714 domain-containing protein [Ruminococcaceae bacterium OttesenSCG-928-I18]
MAASDFDEYYDKITEYCLKAWDSDSVEDVVELATGVMDMPGHPLHYPTHHYLVPAVMLTAARKDQGHEREVLERDLAEALERARNVPGGSCGFQGACGAAVGTGIFWSIITDTAPVSEENWADTNRATGKALLTMAEYGGPRCCKRCSWLALQSVVPDAKKKLRLHIHAGDPQCNFYEDNKECLEERCPFYPEDKVDKNNDDSAQK